MADLHFQKYLLRLNKTIHAYLIDALIVYKITNELLNTEHWYDDYFLECVINNDTNNITHTLHYTQKTIKRKYVYSLIKYINRYYSEHYGEENILDWKNLSDELIMNRYTYAYVRQNIQFYDFKQMLKHALPSMNVIGKDHIYDTFNIVIIPRAVVVNCDVNYDNTADFNEGCMYLILILILMTIGINVSNINTNTSDNQY